MITKTKISRLDELKVGDAVLVLGTDNWGNFAFFQKGDVDPNIGHTYVKDTYDPEGYFAYTGIVSRIGEQSIELKPSGFGWGDSSKFAVLWCGLNGGWATDASYCEYPDLYRIEHTL